MPNLYLNEQIWNETISKIKSVAADILHGKKGIAESSQEILFLLNTLGDQWRMHSDFIVFEGICSETDQFPFGEARKYWAADALAMSDSELRILESKWREEVYRACHKVIEYKFSSTING